MTTTGDKNIGFISMIWKVMFGFLKRRKRRKEIGRRKQKDRKRIREKKHPFFQIRRRLRAGKVADLGMQVRRTVSLLSTHLVLQASSCQWILLGLDS